jgi:hypothetical protein
VKLFKWAGLLLLLLAIPAVAQDQGGFSTRNPLDDIQDEVKRVLSEAGVPFSAEQEQSLTLVLEDSRRASEDLFGDLMDFSQGPPQGEQLDRARAGIEWMNEDFSRRVREVLTESQLKAWDMHLEARAARQEPGEGGTAGTSEQVQEIRINNNPFTTENQFWGEAGSGGSFGFSGNNGNAQIFQRGGTGAYHGSYAFRFRDESLNARNALSSNKPPYQQRSFDINTSGPVIRNRLTLDLGLDQRQSDNAGTVNAITLQGPSVLGFTRPEISRRGSIGGTYQVAERQSLDFDLEYGTENRKNQGMGGLNLPERAFSNKWNEAQFEARHLWFLSERTVQDISFDWRRERSSRTPVTEAPTINVLGAFGAGGNPERNEGEGVNQSLRALWIRTGEVWTVRTGGAWDYNNSTQINASNYLGTFEFPSLDAYAAGLPTVYKVTRGQLEIESGQHDFALFLQNDFRVSSRLTMFFGLRYEAQTNLQDYNNIDPRFSAAYALGKSTVVRAGIGVFHMRVQDWVTREVARLDGTRQYQIVVNDPPYPNALDSGGTVVPPSSRRVHDPNLVAPYRTNTSISVERSMAGNLQVTASVDHQQAFRTLRSRDLNAPLPGTPPGSDGRIPRPDPTQGSIWQVESSGIATWTAFRVSMRQRFSIFNITARYTVQIDRNDSGDEPFNLPSNSYSFRDDLARWSRHQFNASVNARLPFDWYLTTNLNFASGDAYSITTGRDDNGDGITNDRPAGERRNAHYGPGFRNVGLNISKSFPIGGGTNGSSRKSLTFSASMDNAFNMTNLSNPVSALSSNSFGRSVSASDPREIEATLRFQF